MSENERIRAFLGALRRRLLLKAAVETAGFGAAVAAIALLALAAIAASIGPAGFWPPLTAIALAVLLLAALGAGVARPARALRDDRAAARRAGAIVPALASDLLSAIELQPNGIEAAEAGDVSPSLVRAFHADVARAVEPLDPRRLVPLRPATLAIWASVVAAGALIAGVVLSPGLALGLRTLVHRPSLFEGAAVSPTPLVGDVRVTYTYPAYTGLPPRTVDGSTGDLVAVKGARVRLEARVLRSARHALLLLGDAGEREVPATLANGILTAELALDDSGTYRVWLQPTFGRAVREGAGHRLSAEADAAPRVEIQGPADALELETPRPIEVGYTASDDYGLGRVELVFRVGAGPEQRIPLRDAGGARSAQGRTLWDPSTAGPVAGERIGYRIEARDRDDVTGPKVGSSRTLTVVIRNPRESIEDRLERQRDMLEKLLGDLADRVELAPDGHTRATDGATDATLTRIGSWARLHEVEEAHLALLGRLLDDDRREGALGKPLRAALAGVADRLEHVLKDETQALIAARGKPTPAAADKLDRLAVSHVAELERDVLLLDDLVGRQRLEDLSNLGKELTDAHQRLQDLLNRYKATKDENLRRQLEREARELRARIGDLAQQIATLKQRNDVPEEWRNMPDLKQLAERARKLDDMLERGDTGDLSKALDQLGDDLRNLRQMLDDNLDGFGGERFPQENRAVADLMKKVGDLEGDERGLEKETQALAEKQEAETQKRMRGQIEDVLKRENEKLDKLKQRLGGVDPGDPESALGEEVERARESAKQISRLLGEHDLAEAKEEAGRAAGALDRAADHAQEAAENEPRRGKKRASETERAEKNAEAIGEARGLAQEISEDLDKLLPRPSETMSPAEREQARQQGDQQGSIGDRTDETASEAAHKLGKMPGLEKAEGQLRDAAKRMRQASEMLKRSESKSAAVAERDAADRLGKLRDSMQERSMSGGKAKHDPVRIPGADESAAPRAWRQELLDAMKEKAPERFRDDVRRYYEELVK
ncbi:MAG TPA: DUF4175 family protein [Polyangia bacterium]|nr:DUF4175 family protein [Polyangia bacterium]